MAKFIGRIGAIPVMALSAKLQRVFDQPRKHPDYHLEKLTLEITEAIYMEMTRQKISHAVLVRRLKWPVETVHRFFMAPERLMEVSEVCRVLKIDLRVLIKPMTSMESHLKSKHLPLES